MQKITATLGLIVSVALAHADHQMQHGFVLAADEFASHLVASGHHSWQTEVTGKLFIEDPRERAIYEERKAVNKEGAAYFLFQAQSLDLPSLKAGQILTGHIVESRVGAYEPKNIIVKNARYIVNRVLLNLENPFFGRSAPVTSAAETTGGFTGIKCGPPNRMTGDRSCCHYENGRQTYCEIR